MQVNASRLLRSACLSVVALILGVTIVGFTAKAASYSFNSGLSANWTAPGAAAPVWTCTTSTAAGDVCNSFPGEFAVPGITDVANISTSAAMTVNTIIPNAVTLNLTQGNLDIAGGQLSLIGTSTVDGITNPNLSISGGTLSNSGTLNITGPTFGASLTFNGGTLNGPGTTNVGGFPNFQMNFTGTQGPMTIDQQQVTLGTSANFSANNTLTMSNGATITNSGTFTANGGGTIAPGAGSSTFFNNPGGVITKSGGAAFTLAVPFANTGIVQTTSGGPTMAFTGGSAPDHNNATWNAATGGVFNFGGTHVFNGTETFTGTGSMNVLSGGVWTLNTSATLATGLSLANAGTIKFTTPTAGSISLAGGNYTQSGTFEPRLGVGGLFTGGADSINVTGTASETGGTLAPSLASGYVPSNGDLFTVMTFSSLTAAPTYIAPTYPGFVFQAITNPTSIQVQAVAVPDIVAGAFTGPANTNAGTTIVYTEPFDNVGAAVAANTNVGFTLTGGGTITGGSAPGFTCGFTPTTLSCTAGTIAAGGSVTFTINVTAPNQPGPITLTSSGSTTGESNTTNNGGTFTTTVAAVSDVGVTKTGPPTITGGTNITYTIAITNGGPSDATNVGVADTPGSGLTWVSNTGACPTGFPCTIPSLLSGQTITFTSTWAVAPTMTAGNVTNSVTVSATGDPNPGNDTSSSTAAAVSSADLVVTKTGPLSAASGSSINYTIAVTNNGPSYATGVSLDDPAQPGLTFTGMVSGPCGSFPCPLGTMSNGQTITVVASYNVTATSGSVSNVANVTGTSTDPVPTNDSSTATTTVTPNPNADVSITKTAPATVLPGSNVTFHITIANAGPANATNVVVDDIPSSTLTYIVMAGPGAATCTGFPCTIPSIASGSSTTIDATYKVSATATSISNTAKILSASSPDPKTSNNSSTVTRSTKQCPTSAPQFIAPLNGATNVSLNGFLQWTNVGATSYDVYLGPAGSGCATLVGNTPTTTFVYNGLQANTAYEARVVAKTPNCPTPAPLSSPCIKFTTGAGPCNLASPIIISPQTGAVSTSPVHFEWGAVPNAISYHVVVKVDGNIVVDKSTPDTSFDAPLPDGAVEWTVTAVSDNCVSVPGAGRFNTCSPPKPPRAGVVGAPTSGQTYSVIVVDALPAVKEYEYQEATDAAFNNIVSTQKLSALSIPYTHSTGPSADVFFYRVRAYNSCKAAAGEWSKTIRVVIVPAVLSTRPVLNVPHGTQKLVSVQVFIPGQNQQMAFTATATKPWVTKIVPSFGTLTSSGETITVFIDPSQLPNGTFTTSIVLALTPLSGATGRITTNGTTTSYITPVSINLVTPVVPSDPSTPESESLIIPAVGHLVGLNSQWRSDIRVFNSSTIPMNYLLNFVSSATPEVKQTTITTAPGDTTALDDIIHNWYGFGEVGDNASGVLEIRPVVQGGTPSALSTIVSSRTYNLSALGTLGQFIPAVPFSNFVSTGRMSLQQVAQNDNFRTNFGLVEASGSPSNVLLTMFTSAGNKLFSIPLTLNGGEQRQLNGLLSQQGITSLSDGRMEVEVTGGDGKVTAYASVVDNGSGDPLFVPATLIDNSTAESYVMPGVADLNTGNASWRTDMRVFNSGANPQTATLTFYPQGDPAKPVSASVTVNPGEVKVLDNVLQSLFSEQNIGGAVHVDTPGGSQLVVTGRTYNQTATGTLGQFIPAVTLNEAIDKSGRALNILQVEDSVRYRTNVGLAEMTGKPATVEISLIQPDTKITPSIQVPLAANEYVQFPLSAFGLGDVYNARVALRVVDGDGHVTAYGSVIDEITTAPTYVPAQ